MEATLKKKENYTWKFVKKPGNIMEFCHSGKMGTLKSPVKGTMPLKTSAFKGARKSKPIYKGHHNVQTTFF